MSDVLDQQSGEAEPQQDDGPNLKQLRELAKKGEKAEASEARAEAAERRIAILESGIDTATPLGKFFTENFKGDVSDLEAMKAAATELGVTFRDGAEPVVTDTPPEPNGTDERRVLAADSPADTGVEVNPVEEATKQFFVDHQTGATWENAAGTWMAKQAGAALAGDQRVIVPDRP